MPPSRDPTTSTYLILLQAAFRHHLVPLFLEGDNDQGHKDVDKEKREDHKVDHIEDGKLHPEPGAWPLLLIGGVHRVFQHPRQGESRLQESFQGAWICTSGLGLRSALQEQNSSLYLRDGDAYVHFRDKKQVCISG